MQITQETKIEYVTHASICARRAGKAILTDPFFFLDEYVKPVMCHFPPREFRAEDLGSIDFVYSSHIHTDHCHPLTLELLREQIDTVLLPGERPDLEAHYRKLGFRRIELLANGVPLQLGDDLEITSYWDGPVDTAALIRLGGKSLFHQNDCRLTLRTLRRVAAGAPIDFAFLHYTWVQDLYPLLLTRPDDELRTLVEEKEEDCLAYQLACIDALRPRQIFPYSMTMTYFQPDQLQLNGYGRMTPATFRDRICQRRPRAACIVLQPGDRVDAESGAIQRACAQDHWGKDLQQYLANVAEFARGQWAALPPFQFGDCQEVEAPLAAHWKARAKQPLASHLDKQQIALIVIGEKARRTYQIDLGSGQMQAWDDQQGQKEPFLEIQAPASILGAVIDGRYDPFSALYSYRVRFRMRGLGGLTPKDEVWMYIVSFVSLFRPDLQDQLMHEKAV